jgi:hypothetical protein
VLSHCHCALLLASLSICVLMGCKSNNGFEFAKGVSVSAPEKISEGFCCSVNEKGYTVITINVSRKKIGPTFLRLASLVKSPSYFIYEVPTNEKVENSLGSKEPEIYHKDVYYLDGKDIAACKTIFRKYEQYFVDDGMVCFGFGYHKGTDEVFVGRYKVFEVYAQEPNKYIQELSEMGFKQSPKLTTVWDTFTPKTPGKCERLTLQGKTIYNVAEELKEIGFYYAERREN